jgi:Ligand-gated ion channel
MVPIQDMFLSLPVILLLLSSDAVPVQAQQSPSLFVTKFDNSASYRTNVCDRQRMVWDGRMDLPHALRGLNITTIITNYHSPGEENYFTLVNDPVTGNEIIDPMNPGLYAVILDEVAKRAGFQWRNSFAVASPLTSEEDVGKSWTDILLWGVETFDLSMEKWGRSLERVELGVSFPTGWWDSSIVMVERLHKQKRVVNLWSFLSPFEASVWVTILSTIVVTGLLYWFLEYLDVKADESNLEDRPGHTIFYAALVFVGSLEFRPNTHASRILSWSWTFWAVIVTSAYTANMASFLVAPQVDVYSLSTIEQAIQLNARICVQHGGVLSTILYEKYGDNLNLVPRDTEASIFQSVVNGTCDVAAHQLNSFSIYERDIHSNPHCTLDSEKRVVQPVPAGMATAIDTGANYCTSLISHVIDYHMTEMLSDGFVAKAWKTHLNKVGTIDCIKEPPKVDSFFDDTFRLGMQDIGGIFILHAIILGSTVLLTLFQFYWFRTSDKTLSEIFFVKQAKEGAIRASVRARKSLRNSVSNRGNSTNKSKAWIPTPSQLMVDESQLRRFDEEEDSITSEFLGKPFQDTCLGDSSSLQQSGKCVES